MWLSLEITQGITSVSIAVPVKVMANPAQSHKKRNSRPTLCFALKFTGILKPILSVVEMKVMARKYYCWKCITYATTAKDIPVYHKGPKLNQADT